MNSFSFSSGLCTCERDFSMFFRATDTSYGVWPGLPEWSIASCVPIHPPTNSSPNSSPNTLGVNDGRALSALGFTLQSPRMYGMKWWRVKQKSPRAPQQALRKRLPVFIFLNLFSERLAIPVDRPLPALSSPLNHLGLSFLFKESGQIRLVGSRMGEMHT